MINSLFGGSLRISPKDFPLPETDEPLQAEPARALAVLAGGCFWCVEAVYREIEGVLHVVSGYSGGTAETAEYKAVCSGMTAHAEVVQIAYDPSRISFGKLLRVFFAVAHDPTQLNRQGNDVGSQYRSAIFYGSDQQRDIAERYIHQLDRGDVFKSPIVTRLEPLQEFFNGEDYHQNYAELHPEQPYIAAIAAPKVEKLRQYFDEQLKR